MNVNVETVSPVERKLTIEVDAERVQVELDRAYASLGRRVKLRGFRPGHVPRHVLERNFRAEVEAEVVEKLVSRTFVEAAQAHGIEAVAQPNVALDKPLSPGAPFAFSARVEVKPALTPRDYRGLEVPRRTPAVGDAEVDAEVAKLQDRFAQLEEITDRQVAQAGDYALVDHVGTIDGQPFEGSVAEGVTVRVAEGKVEEGSLPVLIGRTIGETAEFDEPFPADHRSPALRGKLAHMKVTLRALKAKVVPAADDALAQKVGVEGIETLEALRARIRADLEKREARRAEGEFKDALVKAALARNEFEVPPTMVERAIDGMIEGTAERFARMGMDLGQMELDMARLRGDLREQAILQVKGSLLLEAIARAERLEPTDEDLEAEIAKVAAEMGVPLQAAQKQMRGKDARAALQIRVREDKALSLLSSAATVTAAP